MNKITSPVVAFTHCLARFYYFIYPSYCTCKPLKSFEIGSADLVVHSSSLLTHKRLQESPFYLVVSSVRSTVAACHCHLLHSQHCHMRTSSTSSSIMAAAPSKPACRSSRPKTPAEDSDLSDPPSDLDDYDYDSGTNFSTTTIKSPPPRKTSKMGAASSSVNQRRHRYSPLELLPNEVSTYHADLPSSST